MSSDFLYRALYVLLHGLFTVFERIFGVLERISNTVVDFCHEILFIHRTNYLKYEIQKKNKLPKHLTVLLGNEEPSHKDLANLVVWCLANRILFLSFFDHKGTLKKQQDKLEKEINKKLQPNDHIIWHDNTGSTYKNGFIGPKIHIKILTEEHGKGGLVNLAQNLCKSPKGTDFSIEFIKKSLIENFEFPDPDLGIYCGPDLFFFNYPPWQIRITEFLSINSHHKFSCRRFLEQLYKYGNCEQRLGK